MIQTAKTVTTAPTPAIVDMPITTNYSVIRDRFLASSEVGGPVRAPLTDPHGFMLKSSNWNLGGRFANLDKLFHTLIMGIVDDPDFAVQKDSQIYEKMLRDPQIYYCLYVRKAAINSLPWTIRPADGKELDPMAQHVAQKAEARLRRIPRFAELLDNIQDALLPGMSVNELVWQLDASGNYTIKSHYPVNKDRVKFDKDGNLYLLSPKQPSYGELCPPYKFITHHFNITDGSWKQPETGGYTYYGRGLADSPLYHYFYFKMMAMKFMMKELERYGLPFKVIYTGPQNAALAEKMTEIMLALKNDSVVAIPGKKGDVDVELLTANRSGTTFALFINYVDSLITKTILGQELMTEMPGIGSYAAAAVHKSVFGIINEQDRLLTQDTLNHTLIKFDMTLNEPSLKEEFYPVFEFKRLPVDDIASYLNSVQVATNLGIPVSVRQIREYTGFREPLEGEEILQSTMEQQMAANGDTDAEENPKDAKNAKNEKDKKGEATKAKKYERKMVVLKCPNCGKLFERNEDLARTVIGCPGCGLRLTFNRQKGAVMINQPEDVVDGD